MADSDPLRIYDIAIDNWRPATQQDISALVRGCTLMCGILEKHGLMHEFKELRKTDG